MPAPTISIIIPTYNRAATIDTTLASIYAQSLDFFEVIIVDDGSTDNTKEVVEPYFQNDRIYYFKIANQGVSNARNYGISKAVGDYLIFLDSDDQLKDGYLEKVKQEIVRMTPDFVFVGASFYVTGRFIKDVYPSRPYGSYSDEGLFLAGTFAVRRVIFIAMGCYDPNIRYGENTELSIRMAGKKYVKVFIEDCLLRINQATDRASASPKNLVESISYTLNKHKLYFNNNPVAHWGYLQILGISYLRMNDVVNGRKYLWHAYKLARLRMITLMRLIISFIPFLRKRFYGMAE